MLHDLTYAACGLAAVLDQATYQLGYDWDFCAHLGQQTTEGRQYCIRFTDLDSGRSVGYIYGRVFLRPCEGRESAIIRALTFIDSSGYLIRDINYPIFLQTYILVHGPQAGPNIDPNDDDDD